MYNKQEDEKKRKPEFSSMMKKRQGEVSYKENGKQEEIQKRWETYALILVKTTKL